MLYDADNNTHLNCNYFNPLTVYDSNYNSHNLIVIVLIL